VEYQDYYGLLGVPKNATEKQIRSAYRKLARQHHPDLNPGNKEAEERFKAINEAYEVLSDSEKRKKYDELGAHWQEYEQWQRTGRAAGARSSPFEREGFAGQGPAGERYEYRTVDDEDLRDMFGNGSPFSDFFETFFTSRRGASAGSQANRQSPRPRSGADREQPIEVSLEDAYRGTTVMLAVQSADGTSRRLEVKIPPGVGDGSRVRVTGQGQPGQAGGAAGDLYLVITVRPDHHFERRGDDLFTRVRAPLTTLLLGGEARVPTPDGRALALNIPAGTQDGRQFRLRGQGMPHLGQPERRGDLHAEVHVQMPERLSPRQRELLAEFARAEADTSVGAGTR
jgi:curved DNA-binding protein